MELIIFAICGIFTYIFLKQWYQLLYSAWPEGRTRAVKYVFTGVPIVAQVLILSCLITLASFDVVDNFVYIVFYAVMGYAWMYLGLFCMAYFFDLSWKDDAVYNNNKAALVAVVCGLLGTTIIYSGANIGDGPGWWTVVVAGGMGQITWVGLGVVIQKTTDAFERITVERDIGCGIRIGAYLLASGIILGRASGGDWTSMSMTFVEFSVGWPVLVLALLVILVECLYVHSAKKNRTEASFKPALAGSFVWGLVYVGAAVLTIFLLPPMP